MKTIVIGCLYQAGQSHIGGIINRAIDAKTQRIICAVPSIRCEKAWGDRYKLILEFPEQDYAFWLGFYLGKDYVMNNRQIFIAPEE